MFGRGTIMQNKPNPSGYSMPARNCRTGPFRHPHGMPDTFSGGHCCSFVANLKKQSQFAECPNDGLSFLPRIRVRGKLQQESRPLGGPGFRIKCGMTGLNRGLTEHDFEKRSQFEKDYSNVSAFFVKAYERNLIFGGRENKPNQSQFQTRRLLIGRMDNRAG